MPPLSGFDSSAPVHVLVIARDQIMRVYTDEVLKRAGFQVHSMSPWEARNLTHDGVRAYSVAVFSHTLDHQDILEMGMLMRRRSPASKLLLLLGPDNRGFDRNLFDATLDGLDGPETLIQEVRRLAASAPMPPASDTASENPAVKSA